MPIDASWLMMVMLGRRVPGPVWRRIGARREAWLQDEETGKDGVRAMLRIQRCATIEVSCPSVNCAVKRRALTACCCLSGCA